MNLGKAREYFSSYYEGALERGLKESFERVLREDAQLQAEYRAFERTMNQLTAMQAEVPIPDNLHDSIMARIDRSAWEQNQKQTSGLFHWWKPVTLGLALAAVAAIAFLKSNGADTTPTMGASLVQPTASSARLDIKANGNGVRLNLPPVEKRTVEISDVEGHVLETLKLNQQGINNKPLTNASTDATLMQISIDGSTTWIALPGSARSTASAGKGDMKTLALEIAASSGIPVVVQAKATNAPMTWTLKADDPHGSAEQAVAPLNMKVELRGGGDEPRLLWILDN